MNELWVLAVFLLQHRLKITAMPAANAMIVVFTFCGVTSSHFEQKTSSSEAGVAACFMRRLAGTKTLLLPRRTGRSENAASGTACNLPRHCLVEVRAVHPPPASTAQN